MEVSLGTGALFCGWRGSMVDAEYSFSLQHSHGKDMAYITNTAIEVINFVKSKGIEVRCE